MGCVLVIDDSADDRAAIQQILRNARGFQIEYACGGKEGLERVATTTADVILLDPLLADVGETQLIDAARAGRPLVPIVIVTSKENEATAVRTLRAGASSYVPKQLLEDELIPTLEKVIDVSLRQQIHYRMMGLMTDLRCSFELENDRELIPPLVGFFQELMRRLELFDETELTRVGIALDEALVNALYHGNLEVSSELRELEGDVYQALALARSEQSPYCDRRVRVAAHLNTEFAEFEIQDEGPGFLPDELPDPTDPANLEKVSGRGVLLMRTFMDSVVFNKLGNKVTMRKAKSG